MVAALHTLEDALAVEEEGGQWPAGVETPSGYPYCGCEDCWVRETLTIAVPRVAQAYAEGLIEPVSCTEDRTRNALAQNTPI